MSWTREGDPIPPKARQESFGQELVLENLQYEDAGKYECEAENSEAMTPERKSFTLKVEGELLHNYLIKAQLSFVGTNYRVVPSRGERQPPPHPTPPQK